MKTLPLVKPIIFVTFFFIVAGCDSEKPSARNTVKTDTQGRMDYQAPQNTQAHMDVGFSDKTTKAPVAFSSGSNLEESSITDTISKLPAQNDRDDGGKRVSSEQEALEIAWREAKKGFLKGRIPNDTKTKVVLEGDQFTVIFLQPPLENPGTVARAGYLALVLIDVKTGKTTVLGVP